MKPTRQIKKRTRKVAQNLSPKSASLAENIARNLNPDLIKRNRAPSTGKATSRALNQKERAATPRGNPSQSRTTNEATSAAITAATRKTARRAAAKAAAAAAPSLAPSLARAAACLLPPGTISARFFGTTKRRLKTFRSAPKSRRRRWRKPSFGTASSG